MRRTKYQEGRILADTMLLCPSLRVAAATAGCCVAPPKGTGPPPAVPGWAGPVPQDRLVVASCLRLAGASGHPGQPAWAGLRGRIPAHYVRRSWAPGPSGPER